jgi:glycosyltransferase involved in cell wall biosynthesis
MLLQQRGIPFHLLVVGHPNINMQPFFKFVKKNNLAKEVEFRLGYIEEADLPGYFSAATIVVLPYREVSQSGVAIGACTFGRAIIATKIGGLKEMVDEAKNGLLVSVDDPFELATALEDLLASESLRREFEQNSKRYSNEALSWSEIAALTANSYRSLSESTRLLDSQN